MNTCKDFLSHQTLQYLANWSLRTSSQSELCSLHAKCCIHCYNHPLLRIYCSAECNPIRLMDCHCLRVWWQNNPYLSFRCNTCLSEPFAMYSVTVAKQLIGPYSATIFGWLSWLNVWASFQKSATYKRKLTTNALFQQFWSMLVTFSYKILFF